MKAPVLFGAAVLLLATAGGPDVAQGQARPAKELIRTARILLDVEEFDSARVLLRSVLDARPVAAPADRVWALVLLASVRLADNDRAGAVSDFREALALVPDLSVDSLNRLNSSYASAFAEALAAVRPRAARTTLGFRFVGGRPRGARLLVNSEFWPDSAPRGVEPGVYGYVASARGYADRVDSVSVESGTAQIVEIALQRSSPAFVSVNHFPAGVVLLDDEVLGETPIVDRPVPAGDATLRIRVTGRQDFAQPIALRAGEHSPPLNYGDARSNTGQYPSSAAADAAYRALLAESALVRYRAIALGSGSIPAAERARAATRVAVLLRAIGISRGDQSRIDSAGTWARRALGLSQDYRPEPGEYGDSVMALLAAVRSAALTLQPLALRDTTVRVADGRLRIPLTPSRSARVTVTISNSEGVVREESQSVSGLAVYDWNLRGRDGGMVPEGRYTIRVGAVDPLLREMASDVQRSVTLARMPVDTVLWPLAPRGSDVLPDTERVRPGSITTILGGLVLAGAAVAIPTAAASADLKSRIGASDPAPMLVAGAAAVAGVVGYLSGTHLRPNRDNVTRNQQRQEQYQRDLDQARRANRDRLANADIRINVEGGTP